MKVIKRSGNIEEVSFDKIVKRLRSLCDVEPKLDIDATDIAQQVISEICDGIKTTELDEEAAKKCAYMVTIDPAYKELFLVLLFKQSKIHQIHLVNSYATL